MKIKQKKVEGKMSKSIGDSYVITVEGVFHSIINKNAACKLLNVMPAHIRSVCSDEPVLIMPRKTKKTDKEQDKYNDLMSVKYHWVDKEKELSELLKTEILMKSIIKITPFKFENTAKKTGFVELENPIIEYYLKLGKFELKVHKIVFMEHCEGVEIVEKRSV